MNDTQGNFVSNPVFVDSQSQEEYEGFTNINPTNQLNDPKTEEISIYNQVDVPISVSELDGYLFDIYQVNTSLYLYLKISLNNNFQTICVRIEEPVYDLFFLPNPKSDYLDVINEIKEVAEICGGSLIDFPEGFNPYQSKIYVFQRPDIPREAEWICASFSHESELDMVPKHGNHYLSVFGISNSLQDCFCIKKSIKGPQWIHLKHIELVNDDEFTLPLYTIDNIDSISAPTSTPMNIEIPTFNTCSMAIRYVHDDTNDQDQILMISLKIRHQLDIESYKSTTEFITFCVSDTQLSFSGTKVVICQTEESLIEQFFDCIITNQIDFLCSYHFHKDVNVLLERINQLNIKDRLWFGSLWPYSNQKELALAKSEQSNYLTENPIITFEPAAIGNCRLICDLRSMVKEYIDPDSTEFSDIVSEEFKNVYRQPLYTVDILLDLKKNPSNLINYIKYNVRDTNFVDSLINKMNLLPLTHQISTLSGLQWSKTLGGPFKGARQSAHCDRLLLLTFSEEGYIIPETRDIEDEFKSTSGNNEQPLQGGHVIEPQSSLYENCTISLDYNSLYPSIIREYNLCFSTINDKSHLTDDDRISLAQKAQKQPMGILPKIMANLLEARSKVRQELKEVETHISHNNTSNDETWLLKEKKLKIQQKSIKILSNAMYGCLAYPYSRFPSKLIASIITCMGRFILQNTVDKLREFDQVVVYGDTDSVMISTNTKDWIEALERAEIISNEISSQYSFLKLGVDSIFVKFLLYTKKKYAALAIEPSTIQKLKTANQNPNIFNFDLIKYAWRKIIGLEIIKHDWCLLAKYLCDYAVQALLYLKNINEAHNEIIKEFQRIYSLLKNDGNPGLETAPPRCIFNPTFQVKYNITVDDLIIMKGTEKQINQNDASDNRFHMIVGRWMLSHNYPVIRDDPIPYIVINNSAKGDARAKHPSVVSNVLEADLHYYLTKQIIPSLSRICKITAGPTEQELRELIHLQNKPKNVVNAIPQGKTLSQLYFECPHCKSTVPVKEFLSNSINNTFCPICEVKIAWKAAANSMMLSLQSLLASWANPTISCNCGYLNHLSSLPLTSTHLSPQRKICSNHITIECENGTLQTLKQFLEMFENIRSQNCDILDLCDYMSNQLRNILSMHGFNRLTFNTLLCISHFE